MIDKKREAEIVQRRVAIDEMMKKDLEVCKKKSTDYAPDTDCMANLKEWGLSGIVVRLGDKQHRLENLLKNKREPNNESIADTLLDIRIYCYLARVFLKVPFGRLEFDERNKMIEEMMAADKLSTGLRTIVESTFTPQTILQALSYFYAHLKDLVILTMSSGLPPSSLLTKYFEYYTFATYYAEILLPTKNEKEKT